MRGRNGCAAVCSPPLAHCSGSPATPDPFATHAQAAKEVNTALLNLQPADEAGGGARVDTAAVLAVIGREVASEQEPTRLEALRWITFLLVRWAQLLIGAQLCCQQTVLDQVKGSGFVAHKPPFPPCPPGTRTRCLASWRYC